MNVDKIKQLLKKLSPKEMAEVKVFINAGKEKVGILETENQEQVEKQNEQEKIDEIPNKNSETGNDTEKEVAMDSEEDKTYENPLNKSADGKEGLSQEDKSVPSMQKGLNINEDNQVAEQEPLETDESRDIPIDFEQIIEAQNAKITALEAENTRLKSKVNSAFGYSAKVSMPVKTNKLYDECSDVHFHR